MGTKWFWHGYAFTGGPIKYGQELGRLSVGDVVLMYASKIGVVGIGYVKEQWDGREHRLQLVYVAPYEDRGYRVQIDWFLDLRDAPITAKRLKEAIGWTPARAVHPICRDAEKIKALIDDLEASPT